MKILHLLFFFIMYFFQMLLTRVQLEIFLARLESWRLGLKAEDLTSMTLLLEKICLDAKSPRVNTVYGGNISLRLAQLNLVSLGTKGNYKEGEEIFLAIVLVCKLSCR